MNGEIKETLPPAQAREGDKGSVYCPPACVTGPNAILSLHPSSSTEHTTPESSPRHLQCASPPICSAAITGANQSINNHAGAQQPIVARSQGAPSSNEIHRHAHTLNIAITTRSHRPRITLQSLGPLAPAWLIPLNVLLPFSHFHNSSADT